MHDEALDGGIMLFSSSNCGVLQCTCIGSCQWGYRNYRVAPESNNYHIMTVYCNTCGKTDGIIVSGSHSYSSNGYCSLCGHYNSAYDQTTVCYHNSTYTTWSGCNWYDYCRDCGQLMASGVSHSYSYGSWQYYNTSQHRRTGTCTSCGATRKQRSIRHTAALNTATDNIAPPVHLMSARSAMRTTRLTTAHGKIIRKHSTDEQ